MNKQWPAPLLQPNRQKDCGFYAVAYLCQCLGYPEVTPEQVRDFREQEHKWEGMFPKVRCNLSIERFWDYIDKDEEERKRYWLGPDTRQWVEQHLASDQIALVVVERVTGMAHMVVLLESRGDEGVYLMDPLYGHCVESWEWFLSIGAGKHGAHHIDGWYEIIDASKKDYPEPL